MTSPVDFYFPKGRKIDISRCCVMGIINVSPDSFCELSRCLSIDDALRRAEQMVTEGAAMLDVGGEATQPGLTDLNLSASQEADRVAPVIDALVANFDLPISVDTSKPEVMRAAVSAGAAMINDVRALRVEGALTTVAKLNVPVCLMHMAYIDGVAKATLGDWAGENVIATIKQFLSERFAVCLDAGISTDKIMLDPGFGGGNFGKTTEQNLTMIKRFGEFKSFAAPLLIGVSRKTAIGDVLDAPESQRINGSIALTVLAAEQGANVVRTHDVKPTIDALNMAQAVWEQR